MWPGLFHLGFPVAQLYALIFGIMLGGSRVLAKRVIKDEREYFDLCSASDVLKMEMLSRMTKSRKGGGTELADELGGVVPQAFTSKGIEVIAVSLFCVGLGPCLAH